MKKWLLLSPIGGLFIGHGMGMAFFSKQEDAGQSRVVTFSSEETATDFALTYLSACGPLEAMPVEVAGEQYATIPELIASGYKDHLGLLLANVQAHPTIQ